MVARYTIELDRIGWSVIDAESGQPAVVFDTPQTGLPLEDADDLADALGHLHANALKSVKH
jgi:hypothetical protein